VVEIIYWVIFLISTTNLLKISLKFDLIFNDFNNSWAILARNCATWAKKTEKNLLKLSKNCTKLSNLSKILSKTCSSWIKLSDLSKYWAKLAQVEQNSATWAKIAQNWATWVKNWKKVVHKFQTIPQGHPSLPRISTIHLIIHLFPSQKIFLSSPKRQSLQTYHSCPKNFILIDDCQSTFIPKKENF